MKKTIKIHGFKKVYNIDKSAFFWRKNIKHPFLKGLHIVIDEAISVYCREPKNKVGGLSVGTGDEIVIIFKARTKKNLLKIIQLLTMY